MADGGATTSGLKELSAAIDRLPTEVTSALKDVARNTAGRIQARAKQLLRSQLKTAVHALVDGIVVIDESEQRRFIVDSTAPPGQWPNLPAGIEHGTSTMAARPYMRPAGAAEDARYKAESLAAASTVADKLGTL